jgi:proteasome assembly chaperone (PAC2) family protein
VTADRLTIHARPHLENPRLLLGLSGWMDGGDVATGTVRHLITAVGAEPVAAIAPEGFYIYNLPGPMEISSLFRPHTVITDGIVATCEFPENTFQADEATGLILFCGKEPHLNWEDFADCVFALVSEMAVEMIYFLGSYSGVVPHTRDPRLYSSVSDPGLKAILEPHGLRFSDYSGPAGISTYLTQLAGQKGIPMATIVAEIPAYIHGPNPRCIEAVTRRTAAILGLSINLDNLRSTTDGFENKVNEAVHARPELGDMIHKMESAYDSELFETQMGDLREWLEEKGIRLD